MFGNRRHRPDLHLYSPGTVLPCSTRHRPSPVPSYRWEGMRGIGWAARKRPAHRAPRGAERAPPELGRRVWDRRVEDLGETAVVEATPKQDGRNMVMVIAPTKKPP